MYVALGVLVFVTMLVGFRVFYQNLVQFFRAPPGNELSFVHGLIMTGWCILFVVQAALVRAKRVDLHVRVGAVGAIFLAVVIVNAFLTSLAAVRVHHDAFLVPPEAFLAFLLGVLFGFAVLAVLALLFRLRPQIHKRLMLVALISALPAGLTRIDFAWLYVAFPLMLVLLTDLIILGAALYDFAQHRRFHSAFAFAFVFVLLVQATTLAVAASPFWTEFVHAYVTGGPAAQETGAHG